MQYKKLWTDMHSNIHHEEIGRLDQWFTHVQEIMDFWPIAYYPFYMRRTADGAGLEDVYSEEIRNEDWEKVREFTKKANALGYPMFMGYEWQGSGKDGDHNVFFLDNSLSMHHPMRYQDLRDLYKGEEVIAIPHHLAYQPGSRGKNWETHDEQFSPVAEIYSSHGSSENDKGPLPMNRHIHMGPRTGKSCYEKGLEQGFLTGVIASGDNHNVPAVYEHGSMCVLAEACEKEAIWAAIKNRRTYGVSESRIEVDYTINQEPMGSVLRPGTGVLEAVITGTDAIDRIEILKNNIVEEMVVHSGTWEREPLPDTVRVKFRVSFGWGPDTRVFDQITQKSWAGSLKTDGKICSIEKCWNSFGQSLDHVTENSCDFTLTTYKSTATGKWMGPSNVVTEGFIFEIEAKPDERVILAADAYQFTFTIRELMAESRILPFYQESEELMKETWPDSGHYRDDLIWHNAHKIKISQAVPQKAYTASFCRTFETCHGDNYRLRIWQQNGHIAWTSPIFIREAGK